MSNHDYNKRLKGFARKLRKESTPGEVRLWTELLRARKMLGYSFNRQRPVLNYIADFMCKDLKLIIEIDGYSHWDEQQYERDQKRQRNLEAEGYTVLRFTEKQVMHDLRNVHSAIEYWIEKKQKEE